MGYFGDRRSADDRRIQEASGEYPEENLAKPEPKWVIGACRRKWKAYERLSRPRLPEDREQKSAEMAKGTNRFAIAYLSVKFALRFSPNAAMPSFWSWVANMAWNSRRSKRTPSASVVS
jgi:hypothetical protein